MTFNDRNYTYDSILKQLGLIELHSRDGSATDAGCGCIEGKHLRLIEGLAEEGVSFGLSEQEKEFYTKVGDLVRALRKNIELENWNIKTVLHESGLNPGSRAYLPHGLTEYEKSHPDVKAMLSRCIKEAELKCCGVHTKDYSKCDCNPVAVCRASVEG